MAFIDAHRVGQALLLATLQRLKPLSEGWNAAIIVIQESKDQVYSAFKLLDTFKVPKLKSLITYHAISILLNRQALKVNQLSENGALSAKEASEELEHIQELLLKARVRFVHGLELISNENEGESNGSSKQASFMEEELKFFQDSRHRQRDRRSSIVG